MGRKEGRKGRRKGRKKEGRGTQETQERSKGNSQSAAKGKSLRVLETVKIGTGRQGTSRRLWEEEIETDIT